MDRPSVTEMERGGVYEMEIEISSIHHSGFACTKPPSRANFMRKKNCNAENFLLVIATVKTRPVLKVNFQGLSDNWCAQLLKSCFQVMT